MGLTIIVSEEFRAPGRLASVLDVWRLPLVVELSEEV